MADTHDTIFDQEQETLQKIYAELVAIKDELTQKIEESETKGALDLKNLAEEVRVDMGAADEVMETLAAIETLNAVIDAYNQYHDITVEKLTRALVLMRQPYFGKVSLIMRPGRPARDVYIGSVGIMDKNNLPLIVDWRNPVAETYYNQDLGPTSYTVDGKERHVELTLRRQFEIVQDKLLSYFDTSVAIEDSLLLKALRKGRSQKLSDITATIQKEQNQIVRHKDVEALVVAGCAGSGKTSVMLQRLAYLFYQMRDKLHASDVWMLTPNALFASYIDQVLPSLGEINPHIHTWDTLLSELGISGYSKHEISDRAELESMKNAAKTLTLGAKDFNDIEVDGTTIVRAQSIESSFNKFSRFDIGPKRLALCTEELHTKAKQRISNLAKLEELQEEMLGLDIERQMELFGEVLAPQNDEEILTYAKCYAEALYGACHAEIDRLSWIAYDRVARRLTGKANVCATELLYCRYLISGKGVSSAKFLMIDEVQDLSAAQLEVLCYHFKDAHLLLLGDPGQAIYEESVSWDELLEIVKTTHKETVELNLTTSYRSSPEITELFVRLGEEGALRDMTIHSVREAGTSPALCEVADGEKNPEHYIEVLREQVQRLTREGELLAIICRDTSRAKWLSKKLGAPVTYLTTKEELPKEGVVCLPLSLAKGLEFERVIVADAQMSVYPNEALAKRCLYTAISRAMHEIAIVSQGAMTELLK